MNGFFPYSEKTKVVTDIHSNSTREELLEIRMKQTEQTPIVHSGGYYVSIAGRGEVHTYISTLFLHAKHMINGTTTILEYIENVK